MGRVMRQPQARRTGLPALDRCYVYCGQTAVDDAVKQVKNGLEHEGLTGLERDVLGGDGVEYEIRTVQRRERFRQRDIFLPKVLHRHGDNWRDLDYQRHILPCIDWGQIAPPAKLGPRRAAEGILEETVSVDLDDDQGSDTMRATIAADTSIILSWMTRQITDTVPNPRQAARIAEGFAGSLRQQGMTDVEIYADRRYLMTLLRDEVVDQVEQHAERAFTDKLRSGEIRFDLEASEPNFKMQESFTMPVAADDRSLQRAGQPVQKSLFDPVFEKQFDTDVERRFAFYVDQHEAIQWWHRVAVRQQHEYYLRGWSQDRIWPDFVAVSQDGGGNARLLVVETKGAHFDGNADTEYKTRVFATLEASLNGDDGYECGEVSLDNGQTSGRFKIVFREESFAEVVA